MSKDKSNFPIFVNYHKEEDISDRTKYEDHFVNQSEFAWMSKSNKTLRSPDVIALMNYNEGLRIPLFIKKSNDEGTDFYFMGDITPIEDSFEDAQMPMKESKPVSVVKVRFNMIRPVEDSIYEYITTV